MLILSTKSDFLGVTLSVKMYFLPQRNYLERESRARYKNSVDILLPLYNRKIELGEDGEQLALLHKEKGSTGIY